MPLRKADRRHLCQPMGMMVAGIRRARSASVIVRHSKPREPSAMRGLDIGEGQGVSNRGPSRSAVRGSRRREHGATGRPTLPAARRHSESPMSRGRTHCGRARGSSSRSLGPESPHRSPTIRRSRKPDRSPPSPPPEGVRERRASGREPSSCQHSAPPRSTTRSLRR